MIVCHCIKITKKKKKIKIGDEKKELELLKKENEKSLVDCKKYDQLLGMMVRFRRQARVTRDEFFQSFMREWCKQEPQWWDWSYENTIDWLGFQIDYQDYVTKKKQAQVRFTDIEMKQNFVQRRKNEIVTAWKKDKIEITILAEISSVNVLHAVLFKGVFGNDWEKNGAIRKGYEIMKNSIVLLCRKFKLKHNSKKRKYDSGDHDQHQQCPICERPVTDPVASQYDDKAYHRDCIINFWKESMCKRPDHNSNSNENDNDNRNIFKHKGEVAIAVHILNKTNQYNDCEPPPSKRRRRIVIKQENDRV